MNTPELLRGSLALSPVCSPSASVLVPLVWGVQGWEVLFEVRSLSVRQPGEVCFPGGRTEPGETPVQTALRETWEELAIPPQEVLPLGLLPGDRPLSGRAVQPVVGVLSPRSMELLHPACGEVSQTFTIPVQWLLTHPVQVYDRPVPGKEEGLPPVLQGYLARYDRPIRTLYWEYEGHGIWGMTARMLQTLLDIWPGTAL